MPSPSRVRAARILAVAADAVQLGALPFFAPGLASPVDEVLDLVVGAAMTLLLGWHIAFLPTFVAELIPFVDLFPTWTVAVLFVTRKGGRKPVPPDPELVGRGDGVE